MLTSLPEIQQWFFHWITEREKCRVGYENSLPKPWSQDPILQNYRFCNVRREDDKVTKWIKLNWRDPFDFPGNNSPMVEGNDDSYFVHPNMVLAMVMARTINWPDTLAHIGFPRFQSDQFGPWKEYVKAIMKHRREMGLKVWTGAYLVSTNGHSMDKIDYIIDRVWEPIYKRFQPPEENTLEAWHKELMKFDGMGSFMAAQVVCDLKHTHVLNTAPDWRDWSAIGPGSRRGLNRYFGRKLEGSISTTVYAKEIALLQNAVAQYCKLAIHAQDVQNCLCEYDKYCRVKLGEGKPRSSYNGR